MSSSPISVVASESSSISCSSYSSLSSSSMPGTGSWLEGKKPTCWTGEEGIEMLGELKSSFLRFLGPGVEGSFCRTFRAAFGMSRRAFLKGRRPWPTGALTARGVKKRLKRRGVMGGGFLTLKLRRGLKVRVGVGSAATAKVILSFLPFFVGVASIVYNDTDTGIRSVRVDEALTWEVLSMLDKLYS
jgi:hypothetical protein